MPEDSASTRPAETRRLAAIMFTDIVGFSRQMGANEARMLRLLEVHNQIIQHAVSAHHGHVIKLMGDAFLVDFPSVVHAVQCAQQIQTQCRSQNAENEAVKCSRWDGPRLISSHQHSVGAGHRITASPPSFYPLPAQAMPTAFQVPLLASGAHWGQLDRAVKRAGKAIEETATGGAVRRRQRHVLHGLDNSPGGPGKSARPAADRKGDLPGAAAGGRTAPELARAEIQEELLPGRDEAQGKNLRYSCDFHSAAATRRSTCLVVQLPRGHGLSSIRAQRTLARDGDISDSRRAREAKVVFVGIGAGEVGVKGFVSCFYAAPGNGQANPQDYPYDEPRLTHKLSSS